MKPKQTAQIRILFDHGMYLIGFVTGHPRWPDANHGPIATSRIVKRLKNGKIETENTIYTPIKD